MVWGIEGDELPRLDEYEKRDLERVFELLMVANADLLDLGEGGTSASVALTLALALSSVVEEADLGDGVAPSLSLSLSLTLRSLPSLPMKKSLDHDLPFTTSPFGGGEACDPTPFSMPVESTRRDVTARGDVVGEMEGM